MVYWEDAKHEQAISLSHERVGQPTQPQPPNTETPRERPLGAGRILDDSEMWSKTLAVETRRLKAKHTMGDREMPLYPDATAVLNGTATEQVSREMKYLAAKLAIVQHARAHGKIQTMKIDESPHPADIPTKPLQGREFVYKRARILGLEAAAPPPPKCQPKDEASPGGATTQEPAATRVVLAARHRTPATSAGAGTSAWYEQLALSSAPWRGRAVLGQADRHERGTWGHVLSYGV